MLTLREIKPDDPNYYKPLDELIEDLGHAKPASRYGDVQIMVEDLTDALHYLKEYRDECNNIVNVHDDYIGLRNEMAEEMSKRNPPLTWDELKTMEGKPVWVKADDGKYKGWVIVGKFYSLLEKEDFDAHVDLYYFGRSMEYSKEMYGYYWQAYRKERG